jgi:hypothetical protein
MTEEGWLASSDPRPMLEFLGDKASARKLRLFAVACCRRGWQWQYSDDGCRAALDTAEDVADGRAGWWAASRARSVAAERAHLMGNWDLGCY